MRDIPGDAECNRPDAGTVSRKKGSLAKNRPHEDAKRPREGGCLSIAVLGLDRSR